MNMTVIFAFGIIVVLQAFGDVVSAKTKGRLPSIFVTAVLFLIGFWTVIPTEIVQSVGGEEVKMTLLQLSGISGALFTLLLTLLVTNMGSLMSIKELVAQWKTIIIGVFGLIGLMLLAYFLGSFLFGKDYSIVAAPPLAGGLAAMDIMVNAARNAGKADLAIISALVFSIQGLFGFPILSYVLRKQCDFILEQKKKGLVNLKKDNGDKSNKKSFKIFPETPRKYQTPAILIAKVAIVSWIAEFLAGLTGGAIHTYVMCLVLGIVATEIGFLDKQILNKSETMGLLMVLLMGFVFGTLSSATPEKIMSVAIPLFGIILLGIAGLIFFGIIIGKLFKETWMMSTAIVITALCGFPPNYILTDEASKAKASNEEEYSLFMQEMLPKVLVGGFTTVTIGSVLVANFFSKFL